MKKLSKAKMGIKMGPFSDEHKKHMSDAGLGHFVSEETRKKLRESMLAYNVRKREGDAACPKTQLLTRV